MTFKELEQQDNMAIVSLNEFGELFSTQTLLEFLAVYDEETEDLTFDSDEGITSSTIKLLTPIGDVTSSLKQNDEINRLSTSKIYVIFKIEVQLNNFYYITVNEKIA